MRFVLFLLLGFNSAFAVTPRSELGRYTLLEDRTLVEQGLRKNKHRSFLDLELNFSAGLKQLMGDLKDTTDPNLSATQKTVATIVLLNKNINTEKFIHVDVTLGAPLPFIKYQEYRLLPNLFYQLRLGTSFSLTNRLDGTTPTLGSYIKVDRKLGIHSPIKWRDDVNMNFSIYRLSRSDSNSVLSSTELVNQEKFFDFSKLTETESSYRLDLSWEKTYSNYHHLMEVQELKLLKGKTIRRPDYSDRAFWHTRFIIDTKKSREENSTWRWLPLWGLHYRGRYAIDDGFYLGTKLVYKGELPFFLTALIDNQTFTIMPEFKVKYFQFNYSMRSPYRNPVGRDEIWMSTIHTVNFNFPIP
jgi:hypothetical protein